MYEVVQDARFCGSAYERLRSVVQQSVADRARPLAEWVAANTDSTAVLATDDDVLMHLYTGRKAIPNSAFTPQEHLVEQSPAFAVQSLRTILAEVDGLPENDWNWQHLAGPMTIVPVLIELESRHESVTTAFWTAVLDVETAPPPAAAGQLWPLA